MAASKRQAPRSSSSRHSPRSSHHPLRRSARLNPLPTACAVLLDATNGNESRIAPPSTPSSKRKYGSPDVNESRCSKRCRRSESADDRSVSYTPGKRRKIKGEKVPTLEELDDVLLRRTCKGLNIEYSHFDDWIEDPRGKRPEDMNIPFLPNEIMLQIFNECRPETLVECMKASKRFRNLLNGNTR